MQPHILSSFLCVRGCIVHGIKLNPTLSHIVSTHGVQIELLRPAASILMEICGIAACLLTVMGRVVQCSLKPQFLQELLLLLPIILHGHTTDASDTNADQKNASAQSFECKYQANATNTTMTLLVTT